ncbi:MAG: CBS domain-containing protein [Myxococcales bacterium]|nr:CBS domain-containing protein [Myxococcales bacterium]
MDLASTARLSAGLGGLAALLGVERLEGPRVLALPGPRSAAVRRLLDAHAVLFARLISDDELARRAMEPIGRLTLIGAGDPPDVVGLHLPYADEVIRVDGAGALATPLILALEREGRTVLPVEAGILLLGVHADTRGFSSDGVTADDHAAASLCLAWGASLAWVRATLDLAAAPTAAEIATTPVYALGADDTVASASASLHRLRVNAMPIRDEAGVVGQISRREVDDALRHGLGDAPVLGVSVGPPPVVAPDAPLADVRRALAASAGRLVLVGDAEPRGVITRSAAFRAGEQAGASEDTRFLLGRSLDPADLALLDALAALAERRGARLFLVGGPVRDLLLGRPVVDLDCMVPGDAIALGEAAAAALGGHLHAHPAFATCTWTSASGRKVDLTSARTESYAARAALPTVVAGGLRHDLLRRDFSVNAMALELTPSRAGDLHDPFGGRADLAAGRLRVLHGLSFHDDPTRAFRAARFAGRFGFDLEPGTRSLLAAAIRAGFTAHLGPERLGAELHRLFAEPEVVRCVALLRGWGLLAAIHPALDGDHGLVDRVARHRDAWGRYEVLSGDAATTAADALWLALAAGVPDAARRAQERLAAGPRGRMRTWIEGPERVAEAVAGLAAAAAPHARAFILERLTPAEIVGVIASGDPAADGAVTWWLERGRHLRAEVGGDELIALGATPGPGLGVALRRAQEAAWDGADREGQLAAARASLGLG